jgi:phosphatidylinositol alpha-1,6-mannosyltransferase
MPTDPIVVNYLHSSARIGGGNIVLLRLIDMLDRNQYRPISVVPARGPMSEQLERRGVETHYLNLHAAPLAMLSRVLSLGRLSWHLRGRAKAIVHANDLVTYGVARRSLSRKAITWICHIHHPDFDAQTIEWALRVPPARILTPSRHVASLVSAALPRVLSELRERIIAVMNPIDTSFFTPDDDRASLSLRVNCDPAAVHLVTAGAIAPHKGQDLFLRTVAALVNQGRPVHGHVIGAVQPGREAYAAELRELARMLGIESRVRFHGFAPEDVVRDLFRLADVFLLPTAEEGFGLVLAEAQACGTPVITTDMPPLDEVVQHGRTGVLVARSLDAIIAAVAELIDAPGRRLAMGRAGREWVEGAFSTAAFHGRVAEIYEDVLAGS